MYYLGCHQLFFSLRMKLVQLILVRCYASDASLWHFSKFLIFPTVPSFAVSSCIWFSALWIRLSCFREIFRRSWPHSPAQPLPRTSPLETILVAGNKILPWSKFFYLHNFFYIVHTLCIRKVGSTWNGRTDPVLTRKIKFGMNMIIKFNFRTRIIMRFFLKLLMHISEIDIFYQKFYMACYRSIIFILVFTLIRTLKQKYARPSTKIIQIKLRPFKDNISNTKEMSSQMTYENTKKFFYSPPSTHPLIIPSKKYTATLVRSAPVYL